MANAEKSENKSKVLVNVYEPLIAIMKHKFDAACLKRDAYLDKALRIEAGFLRDEVKEPNSDRARNFIAENLKELKLKPLSLSLSTETAELITEVCKEKNIPRDSFINRFFLLLIASDTILKALFLFHEGNIENIEEAYDNAIAEYFSDYDYRNIKSEQVNMLDVIEFFSNKSPISNIRELVYLIKIIPKEWEYKRIVDNVWHKKISDNIWKGRDQNDVTYEYIHDSEIPIKPGLNLEVSESGDLLFKYGGYYKWIEDDNLWRKMDDEAKRIKVYSHFFYKNCFRILPDEYGFIKTNNLLGLNTYMTDNDVSKEEALGRTATLAKTELDKLLAFTKSEKTKNVTPKGVTPTAGEAQ